MHQQPFRGWPPARRLLVLLMAALGACQSPPAPPPAPPMSAYDQLLRVLYKRTVPVVRPAALAAELRRAPRQVVLLDARSPAEYRVSHIEGAHFVDFDHYRTLDLGTWPRTQPVVVYCTVGVRSEEVGAWLRQQGFEQVRNLYGGIFQWVNDGQGVVNQQGPTVRVHPYSALWRPWLKQGTPAYQ